MGKRSKNGPIWQKTVCLTLCLRSCTSLCDFNKDIFFNSSIFTIINISFLLRNSWIIFLTWGTLYSILMMSSLFLHSRNRNLKSYYEKTTKGKCVTLSNLKLLLLCFVLFQLLNKIDFCKSRIENLKEINTREFLYNIRSTVLGNQSVSAGE